MGQRPSCAEIAQRLAELENENLRLKRRNAGLERRTAALRGALAESTARGKALEQSERLLSIIADRVPAFVAYVGADQHYRFVNKKYEDVTGLPRSRFKNLHIKSFLGEVCYEEIIPWIEKALNGQSVVYQGKARFGYSNDMWVEANYVPDFDENGVLKGFVALAYDLTGLKKTEEALRKSEEKFKALVQSSSEHIFLLAFDGTYLMSNACTAQFDLPSGSELAGKSIDAVYPADVAEVYREKLRQVLETGRAVDFEHSLGGRGGPVYHLDTLFPVFKENKVWCVGGICRDITRLKNAEQQLKESEQRHRSLLRDMPNPMVRLRPDGALTFVNENYCRLFGKSAEELIGQRIWDNIAAEDHDRLRHHFDSLEAQEPVGEILERVVLPTGEMRWFRWVDRAFFDADGAMTEIQAIGWDVTDEKLTHEALARYAERLSLLRDVEREILQVKSPEEIAAGALRRMRRLILCRRASIQVFDPQSGGGEFLAVESDVPTALTPGTRFPAGFLDPADTLRQGKIHAVADLEAVENPTALESLLKTEGIRAFACIPLMLQGAYSGSVNLGFDSPTALGPERLEIAREAADSVAIAIQNARLYQASERRLLQLRAMARRLTAGEETQRKLFSQELHDRLGPNLTALSINLGLINSLVDAGRTEDAAARVRDSQELVEDTALQMRSLMAEMRPPALDDYGVAAAVAAYAKPFQARTGIVVRVAADEPLPRLDPAAETALFRVAQEGLTNAAKHARAKNVRVIFSVSSDRVRMSIADDGEGFDAESALSAKESPAWGLVTMRERISALGGTFEINTRPGDGTWLVVEIAR